ncbi:MAG TPA: Rab family GTPase [Candidatus Lokiarchaeia archaeon]|nr:Rab family GTPase [Candidatus Lokiarchaeia archaeon]
MEDATDDTSGLKFKVLVLGDWAVGKTSLVRHFVEKKFYEDYLPTLGVNILVKDFPMEFRGEEVTVTFALWDVAGQEVFRPLLPTYHKSASGIYFVADLTRLQSFESLELWHRDVYRTLDHPVPTILLANKCDLDYWVDESFLAESAEQIGAFSYFKTSANTGENVAEAFEAMATRILEEME